jgi:hypothetical protein
VLAARAGGVAAGIVVVVGLAGCGTPATDPSPGPMMTTGTSVPADADEVSGMPGGMMDRSTTAVPPGGTIAGEGLDPGGVAELQAAVDQGAQPWRLDPGMTALAFVQGRLGRMMPRVERSGAGTVVVADGAGGAVSLTLVQPGRTGAGGIWEVTGGTWLR